MATLYLTAVLLGLVVPGARAYPTGAQVGQCDSMMPSHQGAVSQPLNNAPYTVTTSKNTYYAGERIMVTVNGTMNFKGLLLRATPTSGSNSVGSFSVVSQDPPLNFLDCSGVSNSGVTHTDRNNKTAVMVYWTAPSMGLGDVMFRVTVVQSFNTFYVNLTSSAISYMMMNSTAPMTTTNNPNSGNGYMLNSTAPMTTTNNPDSGNGYMMNSTAPMTTTANNPNSGNGYMLNSTAPMTTTNNPDSGNTGTGIAASVAIIFVALLLNRLA